MSRTLTTLCGLSLFVLVATFPSVADAADDKKPAGRGLRVRVDVGERTMVQVSAELVGDGELRVEGAVETPWSSLRSAQVQVSYGEVLPLVLDEVAEKVDRVRRSLEELPSPGHSGTAPVSHPAPRRPRVLAGLDLAKVGGGIVSAGGVDLRFTVSEERHGGYADARWGDWKAHGVFEAAVARAWEDVAAFMRLHGLARNDQFRGRGRVHFYLAWRETMADPARIQPVLREIGRDGSSLWGLYSPDPQEWSASRIVLTAVGGVMTERVLGHEIAHLAYHRFGLREHWRGDSEDFAQTFEGWAYSGWTGARAGAFLDTPRGEY